MFKLIERNSYTVYTEQNGKYYRQRFNFWEKGGYYVPQTRKHISENEYFKMRSELKQDG